MAKVDTWKQLRYFKPAGVDQWGNPGAIDDGLLLRLDEFRHWLGVPIYVLHGVKENGHAKRSYHYKENGACAVDVIIPDYLNNPIDLVLDASRFGFTGIGYYPDWKYRGEPVGGLHLDTRPVHDYKHARWMGVQDERGKQHYVALDFENMVKFAHIGEVYKS